MFYQRTVGRIHGISKGQARQNWVRVARSEWQFKTGKHGVIVAERRSGLAVHVGDGEAWGGFVFGGDVDCLGERHASALTSGSRWWCE